MKWIGLRWDQIRAGLYDPAERLNDMDKDGVDAAVLFSDNRPWVALFELGTTEEQYAAVQAYNTYMIEEWQAADPERIIGLVQMPSTGIDHAIEELERVGRWAREASSLGPGRAESRTSARRTTVSGQPVKRWACRSPITAAPSTAAGPR